MNKHWFLILFILVGCQGQEMPSEVLRVTEELKAQPAPRAPQGEEASSTPTENRTDSCGERLNEALSDLQRSEQQSLEQLKLINFYEAVIQDYQMRLSEEQSQVVAE